MGHATAAETPGDIPSLDWQGRPITAARCADCAHADLQRDGACAIGRS